MAKQKEIKMVLEREYVIPLRKEWLKVPKYKRANKAAKAIKQFLVRHMKIYDRDLRKIKIDQVLNNELRFKKIPPAKIKVKAKRYEDDIVRVELIEIPEYAKFAKIREEKKKAQLEKKTKVQKSEKPEEVKEKTETEEAKEKEEAAKEENLAKAKMQAKEIKKVTKDKKIQVQRKALAK